jgi:transcriptional regulator with XRE-family HTH domain
MIEKKRPHPVDVHVGSRVRMRRVLLGMSQEKLGENLGLTFQQVQKYEKGSNRIGASRLWEIARSLDVPISFFYDGLQASLNRNSAGFEEVDSQDFVLDFVHSSEGLQLIKCFVQISDSRVRRSLVQMVRALSGDEPAEAENVRET